MNRPPRAGFILIFGTRPITSADGSARALETQCPNCGQRVRMIGKSLRNWFTLFFVPVFPVSGAHRFTECSICQARFPVPLEELSTRLSQAEQEQSQRAIGLYNSMRNSPANSITLNELMSTYAGMQEYDQAISAAGEFQQALHASEQCMTTLGRVYLAKDDHPTALKWLNAAVERNPYLGEAQYYKALAHLTATPPDYAQATTAARAARSAGYPRAEELLREAEQRK
jgi:tetratricopeptide (TPR) repeat protein